MYDSNRIQSLMIYVEICRSLISIRCVEPQEAETVIQQHKIEVGRALQCLCNNSRLIQPNDHQLRVNIYHMQSLMSMFQDLL